MILLLRMRFCKAVSIVSVAIPWIYDGTSLLSGLLVDKELALSAWSYCCSTWNSQDYFIFHDFGEWNIYDLLYRPQWRRHRLLVWQLLVLYWSLNELKYVGVAFVRSPSHQLPLLKWWNSSSYPTFTQVWSWFRRVLMFLRYNLGSRGIWFNWFVQETVGCCLIEMIATAFLSWKLFSSWLYCLCLTILLLVVSDGSI